MRLRLLGALMGALLVAALPATATAATLDADSSGNLTFGLPSDDNGLIVSNDACQGLAYPTCINLSELSGEYIDISPAAQVYCAHTPGSPGDTAECRVPPRLTANLGPGHDEFRADQTVSSQLVVNGEDGNDQIKGGAAGDALSGQGGNDAVAGRGGDDRLDGGDGIDIIESQVGSESPDRGTTPFNYPTTGADSAGADTLIGGPGRDNLSYTPISALPGGISISLDGVANDGHSGGDNVGSDIEVIEGSPGDDTMTGDDSRNELDGREGADTVLGRGGDDLVAGYNGNDRLSGEAGNDSVYGYSDDDSVDGGPGRDQIDGDAPPGLITVRVGNDTLFAADGELDGARCGLGTDTAVVDAVDVHHGCENVEVRGGTPGPGPGPGPDPVVPLVEGWEVETVGRLRLRKILKKGMPVRVRCDEPCRYVITLKHKRSVVARARPRLTSAGAKKASVKFTRRAKRKLRRAKRAKFTLSVKVTDDDGTTETGSTSFTVSR